MRIIFSGGGTGGHIFPAIAIANEFKKIRTDVKILFVGAKGKLEEKIVPENNFELKTVNITGLNKSIKGILKLPFKILGSLNKCRKILNEFQPDVVVGTGGFASAPLIYSAVKKHIPSLIQEGNSYPGKVTRFLAPKVNKVVVSFSDTIKYLKRKDNVIMISHPVRLSLKKTGREEANKHFNLDPANKTIFIFGGSQGSMAINNCVKNILKDISGKKINVLWQTGKDDFEETLNLARLFKNVSVKDFIKEIDIAYSAADLVICRAGVSSITELAYLNKPSILIPFPAAAENHQEKNARSLEKENACVVILQNEIEVKLFDNIINLINDSDRLSSLGENISSFSDINSAEKIAKEILKLVK
jgi:UDP-N-acetylglucosamine--N-acetylmuramyl-(pentapeptide) pyrophosphoryl-undecaprenol N-acetylglucosamine transferase